MTTAHDNLGVNTNVGQTAQLEPALRVIAPLGSRAIKIFSIKDVLAMPSPRWLIEDMVEEGGFGTVYGPSKNGKSFVALDMAMCVGTGQAWHGKKVRQGAVVYICAEGGRGWKKRIQAWLKKHGMDDVPTVVVILQAVNLVTEIDSLIAQIRQRGIQPSLIVIDTLARCFSGEENSAKEMGAFVAAAQRLQIDVTAERSAVLIVHHTGKDESRGPRGSNALFAAMDVTISVERSAKDVVTVANEKQKDEEEFTPINLRLNRVTLGVDEDGKPITSCVLDSTGAPSQTISESEPVLGVKQIAALRALQRIAHGQTREWRLATDDEIGEAIPDDTFGKWRKALKDGGYVESNSGCFPARYRLTQKGASAIGEPAAAIDGDVRVASHATTPGGVA